MRVFATALNNKPLSMAHKYDLGFHHHNILATTPNRYSPSPPTSPTSSHAGSGSLLPHGSRAHDMFSCSVRTADTTYTVRCLPAEEDGLLSLSGTDATDAIIGDVDRVPRDRAEDAYPGQQQQQQGGPAAAGQQDKGAKKDGGGLADALRARIPKGPLAEDAVMCEKLPGDEPGRITDEDIAAMRGQPYHPNMHSPSAPTPQSDQPAGPAEQGSSSAAAAAGGVTSRSPSEPANDPEQIKHVVQEETLGEHEQRDK